MVFVSLWHMRILFSACNFLEPDNKWHTEKISFCLYHTGLLMFLFMTHKVVAEKNTELQKKNFPPYDAHT